MATDDGFDDSDILACRIGLDRSVVSDQGETGARQEGIQRVLCALQQKHIAGSDQGISVRPRTTRPAPQEG